ncbi:MAG: hypothetical protein AB1Z67_02950 [Candidatus Limnocylindrales bacterium]
MFNATRAAAFVAVLTMTGTLALVAGPFDRGDQADEPAAPAWTAEDVVPVVVHTAYRGVDETGSIDVTPERVSERGVGMEYELTSDDPRFDGVMYLTVNRDAILGATGASVLASSFDIEASSGGWTGIGSAFGMVGTNDMYSQVVLSGVGANEGLSAVFFGDNAENQMEFTYTGMVFPGSMPEYP